ncbi:MAG: leucine-rich repeat protein [Christensenellaceae bacterium]|jgi:hypothetical protein|nr:leucine-rich repeat protein [Christensenellaceae bacterium]
MKSSTVFIITSPNSLNNRFARFKILTLFLCVLLLLSLFACKPKNPITHIEVIDGTFNQTYTLNSPFTGGKLRVVYEDGTSQEVDITSEMLQGFDTQTMGNKTVTITYLEMTTQIEINVYPALIGIAIKEGTFVTEYNVGDFFTFASLIASFEDGSTSELPITLSMLSGFDTSTAGTKNVTISYNDKSISILINVSDLISPFDYKQLDDDTYELTQVNSDLPIVVIPEYYNGKLVSKISKGVFSRKVNLESLTLPFVGASIDASGDDAKFSYIFSGSNANLPAKLRNVSITNGVKIESGAFENCSYLKSIELPASINFIGRLAFSRVFAILKIGALTPPEIDNSFAGIILNGVSSVIIIVQDAAKGAYKNQWGFLSTSIYTENELTFTQDGFVINNYQELLAYIGLTTSATLSSEVVTINSFAFAFSHIVSLNILSSLNTIKALAFYSSSITQLLLPSTLTIIESNAFEDSALKSLTFNSSISTLSLENDSLPYSICAIFVPFSLLAEYKNSPMFYAFLSIIFSLSDPELEIIQNVFLVNKTTSTLLAYLGSDSHVVTPTEALRIGARAFYNAINVKSVEIAEGVTLIEEYAFATSNNFWSSLTSVLLPSSLLTIWDNAFLNSSLTSIIIPARVEQIGSDAFNGCDFLRLIYLNCVAIPLIGDNIISNATKAILVVDALLNTYINNSNWSPYSNRMFSSSQTEILDGEFLINPTFQTLLAYLGEDSHVALPYGLTALAENLFYNNYNLVSVSLPITLETIGASAFFGCINLSEIVISENVSSIGYHAFSGCVSLLTITLNCTSVPDLGLDALPYSDTLLGIIVRNNLLESYKTSPMWSNYASRIFASANGLETIDGKFLTISGSLILAKYIGSESSVVIPSIFTAIGPYAFSNNTSLKTITIPEGVTIINDGAFSNCTSLTTISFPSSLQTIGTSAFNSCNLLTNIVIPLSVTSIGNNAFSYCNALKTITLDCTTVPDLGSYVFPQSLKLIFVSNPSLLNTYQTTENWKNYASIIITSESDIEIIYDIFVVIKSTNTLIEYLGGASKSVIIPDEIVNIASGVFSSNSSLLSVTLPSNLQTIGSSAFIYCINLTSIIFPASLQSIGEYAFNKCYSLDNIVIPENVTSIGDHAFYECSSLNTLTLECRTLPTFGIVALPSSISTIIVTSELLDSYFKILPEHRYALSIPAYDTLIIEDTFIISGSTMELIKYTGNQADVIIPAGITSIAFYAFDDLEFLKSVDITDGVISIGSYAFNNCINLVSVSLPISLQIIDDNAFFNSSLSHIYIPSNVVKVGSLASCGPLLGLTLNSTIVLEFPVEFYYISSLRFILVPDLLLTQYQALYNAYSSIFYSSDSLSYIDGGFLVERIDNSLFLYRGSSKHIIIPNELTSIGKEAFKDITYIETVTISQSVTKIDSYAFDNCYRLKSVTLPNSLVEINENAFSNCHDLKNITIPSNVALLDGAFNGSYLETITLLCNTVPTLHSYLPSSLMHIYVPSTLLTQYLLDTRWGIYSDYILSI